MHNFLITCVKHNFVTVGLRENLDNLHFWLKLMFTLESDVRYSRVFFDWLAGEYDTTEDYPECDPFHMNYIDFLDDSDTSHPVGVIAHELSHFTNDLIFTLVLWYRIVFFRGGENFTELFYYFLGHTPCNDLYNTPLRNQYMFWNHL
jgi:hypothetical protein